MPPTEVAPAEDAAPGDRPIPPVALEGGVSTGKEDGPIAADPPVPGQSEVIAVWRLLRRLGVRDADVDDATQQVFLVVAQRRDTIGPGKLRAFLYGTALRVARHTLSRVDRRTSSLEDADAVVDDGPSTEELVDRHLARLLLDSVLQEMSFELRTVFVFFELEDLSMSEIASVLDLPRGTVASRLRRAREEFRERLARRAARSRNQGGRK